MYIHSEVQVQRVHPLPGSRRRDPGVHHSGVQVHTVHPPRGQPLYRAPSCTTEMCNYIFRLKICIFILRPSIRLINIVFLISIYKNILTWSWKKTSRRHDRNISNADYLETLQHLLISGQWSDSSQNRFRVFFKRRQNPLSSKIFLHNSLREHIEAGAVL